MLVASQLHYWHDPLSRPGVTLFSVTQLPQGVTTTTRQEVKVLRDDSFAVGRFSVFYAQTSASTEYNDGKFLVDQRVSKHEARTCRKRYSECKVLTTPKGQRYRLHFDQEGDAQRAALKKEGTLIWLSYDGRLTNDQWGKVIDSLQPHESDLPITNMLRSEATQQEY